MRKFLSIIFVFLLVFSTASAELDLKSMTNNELETLLNQVKSELFSRLKPLSKDAIIVEDDMIKIYATGQGKLYSDGSFGLEVVFENKSDKEIGLGFDHIIINGWETEAWRTFSIIKSGRKTKEYISISYKDAELESYKEIEDIEFSFHIYSNDYKTIKKYDDLLFNFNGSGWK